MCKEIFANKWNIIVKLTQQDKISETARLIIWKQLFILVGTPSLTSDKPFSSVIKLGKVEKKILDELVFELIFSSQFMVKKTGVKQY